MSDAEVEPGSGSSSLSSLPPLPPLTRRELLIRGVCGFGVLFDSIRYYVTLPLVGYVLTRPVQAAAIRPSTEETVIGGAYARVGLNPLWVIVVLATASYCVVTPLKWYAGRRYGDRVARLMLNGYPKMVDRLERFTARWGAWGLILAWFTPVPLLLVEVGAGTSGMSLRRFIPASVAGRLLWVGLLVGLGYGIGQPAVTTVKRIGHYSLYVTLGAIVVAVVVAGFRGYRVARAQQAVRDAAAAAGPASGAETRTGPNGGLAE